MSSRPAIVNVFIAAIAIVALVSVAGCGQQTHPAALGSANTSTPSALERTVVAQQTTIAQLQSTITVPTATPSPLATDTPIPEPSATATAISNILGAWLIDPIAIDTSTGQGAYKDITATLTVRNTSENVDAPGSEPDRNITLQVRTDAGYLYPQTNSADDSDAMKIQIAAMPPGFALPFVAVFHQIPANATATSLIATGGTALGGGSITLPLASLPRTPPSHLSLYPSSGYVHIGHIGDTFRQGPLTFQILSARLRPYCTLRYDRAFPDDSGTWIRWALSLTAKMTNHYGYALSIRNATMRVYNPDGNTNDRFGPVSSDNSNDPVLADAGRVWITGPASGSAYYTDIPPGQSAQQEFMGAVSKPEHLSDQDNPKLCANPAVLAPHATSYKLLVDLPPVQDSQSSGADVAPESSGLYDLTSLTTGPLYTIERLQGGVDP